ncbi:MAG: class I tRNA ligase family protein [Tabrizicola sp.]|nr:class I tRNA ligase family protein [Tabrizicola sp.]
MRRRRISLCATTRPPSDEAVDIFIRLVAPIAPHFAEECWRTHLGHADSVFRATWPVADPAALVRSEVEIAVQIQIREHQAEGEGEQAGSSDFGSRGPIHKIILTRVPVHRDHLARKIADEDGDLAGAVHHALVLGHEWQPHRLRAGGMMALANLITFFWPSAATTSRWYGRGSCQRP